MWYISEQFELTTRNFNREVEMLTKDLNDLEAKITLAQFMRHNLGFSFQMLSGFDMFPIQEIIIRAILLKDISLVVAGRGFSKSTMLSVLSIIYPMFYPNSSMCLVSSNFRNARRILETSEKIVEGKKAGLLRKCFTENLRRSNDIYRWKFSNQSDVFALPLSTGEGLRGTRCHFLCQDEKVLISKEIEDVILKPFLSVKPNVQEENEIKRAEEELIKKGLLKDSERMSFPRNKYAAFSSASFQFQHLYQTYQEYLKAIKDAAFDKNKPSYFVMRASYEAMPVGQLFDMTQIDDAKKDGGEQTEVFKREYRAIFTNANDGYFNVKKLHESTVLDGDTPCVQLSGDKNCEFLLTVDTSYSSSKSSDYFAMSVFLLGKEERKIFQVHTYARAGGSLVDHYNYLTYLLTHFNIVFIGIDDAGSEFISSYSESVIAKDAGIKLNFIKSDLDDEENYLEELEKAKISYNLSNRTIVYGMKPQSAIIRRANELLQAHIEAKKVWFASRMEADEKNANRYKDLIGRFAIKNKNDEIFNIIDFIEDQNYWINETKAQVGLIEVKASALGSLSFELPQSLRRSDSPNRARKDCYTALLLGNISAFHYYNLIYAPKKNIATTFSPIIIR